MNIPTNGLIAHYTMDNISGNTLVDETGNYNGTITGATQVSGRFNNSMSFDGVNDHVVVGTMGLTGGQSFTVSAFIKADHLGGASDSYPNIKRYVFGFGGMGANKTVALCSASDGLMVIFYANDTLLPGGNPLTVGQYAHVALVYKAGGNTEIWVNGALFGQVTTPATPYDATNFTIGSWHNPASYQEFWDGEIDQFRIFNRALTADEIALLAFEDLLKPSHPDLVAMYTMDAINGTVLEDATGNYPGTITGATQVNGIIKKALSFDGTQDTGVQISSLPLPANGSAWAVSLWFHADFAQNNTNHQIFSWGSLGVSYDHADNAYTGSPFIRDSAGTWHNAGNHALASGAWHHVLLNCSGTTLDYYVNNALSGSITWDGTFQPEAVHRAGLHIGSSNTNSPNPNVFQGDIDQLRYFNRALTAAEVATLYAEPITSPTHPAVVAMYTMDNISGNTLVDETGSYDGTITGATQVAGHLGKALSFTTSSDLVYLGGVSPLPTNHSSISFWINLPAATPGAASKVVLSGTASTSAGGDSAPKYNTGLKEVSGQWILYHWRHQLNPYYYRKFDADNTVPAGWTHICVIFDESSLDYTAEVYINGVLSPVSYESNGTPGQRLRDMPYTELGRDRATDTGHLLSELDQLRIFNRALTQAEINLLYSEQSIPDVIYPITDPRNPRVERMYTTKKYVNGYLLDETGNYNSLASGCTFNNTDFGRSIKTVNVNSKVDFGMLDYRGQKAISVIVKSPSGGRLCQNGKSLEAGPGVAISPNRVEFYRGNASSPSYVYDQSLILNYTTPPNEFFHLLVQIDEPNVNIYINGVQVSTGTLLYPIPASNFSSGAFNHGGYPDYTGSHEFSNFRFIQGVLTQDEIDELVNELYDVNVISEGNDINALYYGTTRGTVHSIGYDGNKIFDITNNKKLIRHIKFDATMGDVLLSYRKSIENVKPNGDFISSKNPHNSVISAISLDSNSNIYSGSYNGSFKKVNPNGDTIWTYNGHSKPISSILTKINGTSYTTSYDNSVRKIDQNGNQVWKYSNNAPTSSVVVCSDNSICFGSYDGCVRKLDDNGNLIWLLHAHENYILAIDVDENDNIYSASSDNTVKKISPIGNVLWSFDGHSGPVFDILYHDSGFIYTVSGDKTLRKIDLDGNEIWTFSENSGFLTIIEDVVYKDDPVLKSHILEVFKGNDKNGVWYDPSDVTTLYQDVAGTIPVENSGEPVGLMLDKSGNDQHATQSTSSKRPIYRTDGTEHWLEFDGVDDYMDVGSAFNLEEFSVILSASPELYNRTLLDNRGSGGLGTKKGWSFRTSSTAWDYFPRGQFIDYGDGTNLNQTTNALLVNDVTIVRLEYNKTNFSVSFNGSAPRTLQSSGQKSILTNIGGRIGSESGGGSNFYKGKLYQVFVADGSVSAENTRLVESDMSSPFSILLENSDDKRETGFIALAFACNTTDREWADPDKVNASEWDVGFGDIQEKYPMTTPLWKYVKTNNSNAETGTVAGVFPYFNHDWILELGGINAVWSGDRIYGTYEFLDAYDNVIAIIKTDYSSTYSHNLRYGTDISSMTNATNNGSYTLTFGIIEFLGDRLEYTPTRTQGGLNGSKNAFSLQCDTTKIAKIRCSVSAKSTYTNGGMAYTFLRILGTKSKHST